ncbi:xanthine dehydrogenase accessory protein XdhC [Deinococcus peraridilitoris]|uniref:Xanthine dehydrogenase accessory protein XdhC n=1 Tax=Deinococcus peraridilitoris (strain DSM 19664 / LMG 22246 / CIP 109416 / KR-200) TaxID=937777 RepID=K9ZY69_DEIPD|nr:xanthine dehydrogenase accessory protein XdhC [Deinococcus peraridilitoris]AFZ65690.1 xanthine dehydrogenase accessory protein XdhC [Deinococcus peraridilitoris DSM 19664]
MRWLSELQRLTEQGVPAVVVTLLRVRGHAPREPGAKMIVTAQGTSGSVGGGNLEITAIRRARTILERREPEAALLELRLTDSAPVEFARQCCGGEITLLLEPFYPQQRTIAIFGLGHVGAAIARALAPLPVNLHLVDSRAAHAEDARFEYLQGENARLTLHHAPLPEVVLRGLPANSLVLVMTHDHAEDLMLMDAALYRADLGYIGLIGSKVKWLRFQQQLRTAGHTEESLSRVTSPIGVPGIRGKSPEVIAIAVAAQLLQLLEAQPSLQEVTHA